MRFEQLLHETIDEMADEMTGPSAGLAGLSMARGRRIRRTRRLAAAGGAVLAAVALVLPWVILSRPGGEPRPPMPAVSGPSPTAAAAGLPGGWVVTGAGSRVLDRTTGEYVAMQAGQRVLPAPFGDRVLIEAGQETLQLYSVGGTKPVVIDTADLGGDYRWSPQGDRLVGRASQKEPFKIGFAVIDAQTGDVTRHWVDTSRYDCSRCTFTWTRDGSEVIMAIADRSGGEAVELVGKLQRFDATTGEPTGSLPVRAMPTSPFSFSPDGRSVIADPDGTGKGWQLIDTASGQARPFPHDAVWATADRLLAVQNGKVLTLTPDGTVIANTDPGIPDQGEVSLGPPG